MAWFSCETEGTEFEQTFVWTAKDQWVSKDTLSKIKKALLDYQCYNVECMQCAGVRGTSLSTVTALASELLTCKLLWNPYDV